MFMTREDIVNEVKRVFSEQFEVEELVFDTDLRDAYEFDSIDAIELLREIEIFLGTPLSRDEKKMAMEIRTADQIVAYIEQLASKRKMA